MRTTIRAAILGGAVLAASGVPAAAGPPEWAKSPGTTFRPVSSTTPTPRGGYWGAAPVTKKPSAVRRMFSRFIHPGASSDGGAMKVYRDPTTGRTNAIGSKPWLEEGH